MIGLYVLIGLAVVLGLWLMALYNGLVKKRNMVQEGWSGIEVQLKRRANLIPNLVETVKGYVGHEKGVLEEVTKLRGQSLQGGAPAERSAVESALGGALGRLMAISEAYPDLKANQNFLSLQGSLSEVEEQIQLSRRYYNGTVRDLNIAIQSFPANLVADRFGFKEAEFFELENEADRAVPQVNFGNNPA